MAQSKELCALDLFSGAGGLTLGLKKAGFRVLGAVEVDPLAVETYRRNHRKTHVWQRDIRRVPAAEVMSRLRLRSGQLDLLAGCPPCEGFSTLRTLNGKRRVRDPRNDLLFEFLRFVRVLRPRAIMLENVPRLARTQRFSKFLKEIRRLGYDCTWAILDAADFGVPQRRKRLILVAAQEGSVELAEGAGVRRTVRETIAGLPAAGTSGDALHDLGEERSKRIRELIRCIPEDGGSRLDLGKDRQLKCHIECDGFKDVYGRMSWDDVAPTITSGCFNPSKGRFLHPKLDRAVTLREAALLQSFPPKYFFSLRRGKSAAAALIGDALPPEFVKQQAVRVKTTLIQDSRIWSNGNAGNRRRSRT